MRSGGTVYALAQTDDPAQREEHDFYPTHPGATRALPPPLSVPRSQTLFGMDGKGREVMSQPELLLTPDMDAKNILARMCREALNRKTRNRREAQRMRRA